MTNKKVTKNALLSSVLGLLLCITMLVGSTFAWFTDTVTSTGNKIVAGSLKIDLQVLEEDGSAWTSVKETEASIFDHVNWEPGYTQLKVLRVVNEGSLALKWKAVLFSSDELTELADVIDVYVKTDVEAYPQDREELDGWSRVGTLTAFLETFTATTHGVLKEKENATLGIALQMQKDANNMYQGMDLGGEFDLKIVATQLAHENDSFNDQYDSGATYPGIPANAKPVATVAELKEALAFGGNIYLTAPIQLDAVSPITEDTGIFSDDPKNVLQFAPTAQLNVRAGKTLVMSGVTVDNDADFGFNGEGKLEIEDLSARKTTAAISVGAGSTLEITGSVIRGITAKGTAVIAASGAADARATVKLSDTVITDCAGGTGAIINTSQYTDVYIEDGTVISDNVSYDNCNHGIIKVYSGSVLYMNGGEICDNVYSGNGMIGLWGNAKMVMNGGKIYNNSYVARENAYVDSTSDANGRYGLIYVHRTSAFEMHGGEIVDNTVGSRRCGVLDSINGWRVYPNITIDGGTVKNNVAMSDGVVYEVIGCINDTQHMVVIGTPDIHGSVYNLATDSYVNY